MTRITWIVLSLLSGLLAVSGVLAEPPVVTQVEPRQGFVDEATSLTLNGANFAADARSALLAGGPRVAARNVLPEVGAVSPSLLAHGTRLYVTSGSRLQIVDATDAAAPWLAGTLDIADCNPAFATDGLVYALCPDAILRVIDVSDPADPHFTGEAAGIGGVPLAQSADALFLGAACGEAPGLLVVGIRDPMQPAVSACLPLPEPPVVAATAPGIVFAASETWWYFQARFFTIDVTDVTSPHLVADIELQAERPQALTVVGTTAFIARWQPSHDEYLIAVDVADPLAPRALGVGADCRRCFLQARNERLAIGRRWAGLELILVHGA